MTKFTLSSASDQKKTSHQNRAITKMVRGQKDTMFIDVFLGLVIGFLVVLIIFL